MSRSLPVAPATRRKRLKAGPVGTTLLVYGRSILPGLGDEVQDVLGSGPCLLVSDRTVDNLYGSEAASSLQRAGFEVTRHAVASGERSKTMEQATRILRTLAGMGAGRDTPVIALGGGTVTDLAGFAAALYARGVPWVAVPTTTLGMCDAAVGGKTAVDLPEGKNLAGAFHAPRLVLADVATLRTLSDRHRRNGLAEVVKMDLLGGVEPGLVMAERGYGLDGDEAALNRAVARGAWLKADIVAEDPRETSGSRVLLNLGHTAGHALETATRYDGSVLHGEGVAVGIVVAARIARGRRLLSTAALDRLIACLDSMGLPTAIPTGVMLQALERMTRVDKKRRGGRLRMVLPRTRAAALVRPVEAEEFLDALRECV